MDQPSSRLASTTAASASGSSATVDDLLSTPWRASAHVRNWPMLARLRFGAQRPVVLRLRNGLRMACRPNTSDWSEVREMCIGDSYEAARRYLAKRDRRGLVLDLGAGTGCFSLWCAATSPGAQILAYEPESSNADAFAANLALNPRLANRIVFETRAVPGVEGTVRHDIGALSFANLVRAIAGPIELVRMDLESSELSSVDETPADVWDQIPAIAIVIHEDAKHDMVRQRLLRRFDSLGYALSTDHRAAWFFERPGPRWRRSQMRGPSAETTLAVRSATGGR